MPANAVRARNAMARKIVSAVVAPTPTRKPARHDRVTVCEAMIAFTGPGGTQVFNAHFLEARSAPRIAAQAKTSWLSDLVDAATDRDVVVTVENVDEPPEVLRKVLDAVPDLRYCLDVGHAHLDKRADGARKYLAVLGDRLGLAHIHDNHGGQGEPGDEHLPFGQGTIDLERDVTALKESGYEGYATLEIFKGIPDDKKACLRKMRRWTREDAP